MKTSRGPISHKKITLWILVSCVAVILFNLKNWRPALVVDQNPFGTNYAVEIPNEQANEFDAQVISKSDEQNLSIIQILRLPDDNLSKKNLLFSHKVKALPGLLEPRYASLFNRLGLSGENKNAVLNTVVLRDLVIAAVFEPLKKTEVYVDYEKSRPNGGSIIEKLTGNLGNTIQATKDANAAAALVDAEVRKYLSSDEDFQAYLDFNAQFPFRNRVENYNQYFQKNNLPIMTEFQVQRLVQDLTAANTPQVYDRNNVISDGVLQAATTYLSSEQLKYLELKQKEGLDRDNAVDEAIKTGRYNSHR